jgi:serine/threonine protein kinase
MLNSYNFRKHKVVHCKAAFYTPHMHTLLTNLDEAFKNSFKILKHDSSSSVALINVDEHVLVLKRSNTKDWLHFLRRLFLQSRAKKNWDFAHELLQKGLKTFEPVALVEEYYGPFKGRSYFISTYIKGKDLREYFLSIHQNSKDLKEIIQNITYLFHDLSRYGLIHRDLSLGNIILLDNQPWLIDFDSMRRYNFKYFAKRAAKRQQQRFLENCCEIPQMAPEIISIFQSFFMSNKA